jgi:hypothetical protein
VLGFGTLGGWLGGQFSSGKFVLGDRAVIQVPESED